MLQDIWERVLGVHAGTAVLALAGFGAVRVLSTRAREAASFGVNELASRAKQTRPTAVAATTASEEANLTFPAFAAAGVETVVAVGAELAFRAGHTLARMALPAANKNLRHRVAFGATVARGGAQVLRKCSFETLRTLLGASGIREKAALAVLAHTA